MRNGLHGDVADINRSRAAHGEGILSWFSARCAHTSAMHSTSSWADQLGKLRHPREWGLAARSAALSAVVVG